MTTSSTPGQSASVALFRHQPLLQTEQVLATLVKHLNFHSRRSTLQYPRRKADY
jgi:hypothetical protein